MAEQTNFGYQPHPFWQALSSVVEKLQQPSTSKTPWGMHEPTHTAAEGIGPLAGQVGDTLADPRNAWMGVGPLAAISRPAGWGVEVLRRFKLRGGTPTDLNTSLTNRAVDTDPRNYIVSQYRKGTDIAAPPQGPMGYMTAGEQQGKAMEHAGDMLNIAGQGERRWPKSRGASMPLSGRENIEKLWDHNNWMIPSGTKGQAAYDAVSRQVGRMLDSVEYKGKRPGYGPAPLADKFYKDKHERINDLVDRAIDHGEAGRHSQANRIMGLVERLRDGEGNPPFETNFDISESQLADLRRSIAGPNARPNTRR